VDSGTKMMITSFGWILLGGDDSCRFSNVRNQEEGERPRKRRRKAATAEIVVGMDYPDPPACLEFAAKEVARLWPDLVSNGESTELIEKFGERQHKIASAIDRPITRMACVSTSHKHCKEPYRLEECASLDIQVTEPCAIMDRLVSNHCDSTRFLHIESTPTIYEIPPSSSFVMGDCTLRSNILAARPKDGFNFVVLDPPWENKSVSRSNMYPVMNHRELLCLPLKEILNNDRGALVLVWCTNRALYHKFILEELFDRWGLTYVTTWHWLKITPSGEPVVPINGKHKRPYEPLFIGRLPGLTASGMDYSTLTEKTICSIPSEHSRKPAMGILRALLKDWLPTDAVACELFARNLTSGACAVGFEVLSFQPTKECTWLSNVARTDDDVCPQLKCPPP